MSGRYDGLNVITDDIERTAEERKTDEYNHMYYDGELEGALMACDALLLLVLDRDRMSVSDRINLYERCRKHFGEPVSGMDDAFMAMQYNARLFLEKGYRVGSEACPRRFRWGSFEVSSGVCGVVFQNIVPCYHDRYASVAWIQDMFKQSMTDIETLARSHISYQGYELRYRSRYDWPPDSVRLASRTKHMRLVENASRYFTVLAGVISYSDLRFMGGSLDANGVDSNDHIRGSDFLDGVVDEMCADEASWQRFHDMLHRLDPATSVSDYREVDYNFSKFIVDNIAMPLSSIVHLIALYGGRNYPGSDQCIRSSLKALVRERFAGFPMFDLDHWLHAWQYCNVILGSAVMAADMLKSGTGTYPNDNYEADEINPNDNYEADEINLNPDELPMDWLLRLGRFWLEGSSYTAPDCSRARTYLEPAAALSTDETCTKPGSAEHTEAVYLLGEACKGCNDLEEAAACWRRAAEHGEGDFAEKAVSSLADLARGAGDHAEERRWRERSGASQNLLRLGHMARLGQGMEQSEDAAMEYWHRAFSAGLDADSLHDIGAVILRDFDARHHPFAVECIRQAAETGSVPAACLMGSMLAEGGPLEQNLTEARSWLTETVEHALDRDHDNRETAVRAMVLLSRLEAATGRASRAKFWELRARADGWQGE